MYKYLILLSFCFSCMFSFGQPDKILRYKDSVFSDITVEKNIPYASDIPVNAKKKYFDFDLYQSLADSIAKVKRPLIIWMHGGGFKFGSKNDKEVQLWCNSFAQHGYVCVAINYRLSAKNTLFKFKALISGTADAVEDARQAVGFFKVNAKKYKIDTNCIILAGNSAGAIIALQAAYSTPAELAGLSGDSTLNMVEIKPGKIAAVINFWGAMFDIAWLKNANVPIVSVHGRNDHTVPIDHKGSSFFGSIAIHREADKLHIPNGLKIYEGYAHELDTHFNPLFSSNAAKHRRLKAAQFAADFLYDTLFKK